MDQDHLAEAICMRDPNTGLAHAALTGARKQSVADAERLLSYSGRDFMLREGYHEEASYTYLIAAWHEARDGRGITQLQRCRANYFMLTYSSEGWMPWYHQEPHSSHANINR